MHIIIGFLGSLVSVLWLLHRLAEMGIDLGGLNPWLWQRRRRWKKNYEVNPIFRLDGPLELTALLLVATAKADGEMSSEEKRALLDLFENDFHLSKREAAGLMISSTHLLGRGDEVRDRFGEVMAPSLEKFTTAQAESAIALMKRVAAISGEPTEMQLDLIRNASALLSNKKKSDSTWN